MPSEDDLQENEVASLNNFAEKPFTQLIHLAYQILLQPAQSESLLGIETFIIIVICHR